MIHCHWDGTNSQIKMHTRKPQWRQFNLIIQTGGFVSLSCRPGQLIDHNTAAMVGWRCDTIPCAWFHSINLLNSILECIPLAIADMQCHSQEIDSIGAILFFVFRSPRRIGNFLWSKKKLLWLRFGDTCRYSNRMTSIIRAEQNTRISIECAISKRGDAKFVNFVKRISATPIAGHSNVSRLKPRWMHSIVRFERRWTNKTKDRDFIDSKIVRAANTIPCNGDPFNLIHQSFQNRSQSQQHTRSTINEWRKV